MCISTYLILSKKTNLIRVNKLIMVKNISGKIISVLGVFKAEGLQTKKETKCKYIVIGISNSKLNKKKLCCLVIAATIYFWGWNVGV